MTIILYLENSRRVEHYEWFNKCPVIFKRVIKTKTNLRKSGIFYTKRAMDKIKFLTLL